VYHLLGPTVAIRVEHAAHHLAIGGCVLPLEAAVEVIIGFVSALAPFTSKIQRASTLPSSSRS
jgi:hypothetical protein